MCILYLKASHSPTNVTGGQIVAEGSVSLSVNVELDNEKYDALLPVDEKERLGTSEEEPG
jgi:hypothetical protein